MHSTAAQNLALYPSTVLKTNWCAHRVMLHIQHTQLHGKFIVEDTNIILKQTYTNNPSLHPLLHKCCIMNYNHESNESGLALQPMSLVRVTFQWHGVTYKILQMNLTEYSLQQSRQLYLTKKNKRKKKSFDRCSQVMRQNLWSANGDNKQSSHYSRVCRLM
jgi:hypothetical protein